MNIEKLKKLIIVTRQKRDSSKLLQNYIRYNNILCKALYSLNKTLEIDNLSMYQSINKIENKGIYKLDKAYKKTIATTPNSWDILKGD